jgi:hypothetical protein
MKNKILTWLAIHCVWLVTHAQAAPEIAVVTEPACNGEVIDHALYLSHKYAWDTGE